MRLYRLLLHLYPSSFRVEYGDELRAIFEKRWRAASGALSRLALLGGAGADVLGNALRVHLDLLRQDARYTLRTFARSPGFAATAIVVTALGVGATTATYSIADHVLLRPLPFRDPDRLVKLWQTSFHQPSRTEFSPAVYRDWKRRSFCHPEERSDEGSAPSDEGGQILRFAQDDERVASLRWYYDIGVMQCPRP